MCASCGKSRPEKIVLGIAFISENTSSASFWALKSIACEIENTSSAGLWALEKNRF